MERKFPIQLSKIDMTDMCIQKKEASQEADRVHILNWIASKEKGVDLDATPPEAHP